MDMENPAFFLLILLVSSAFAGGVGKWPDGVAFQLSPCNASDPRNLWTISTWASVGFSTVPIGRGQDPNPGPPSQSCLDSNGGGLGVSPHLWSCDPSANNNNVNQQWLVQSASGALMFVANQGQTGDVCLGATAQAPYAALSLFNCKAGDTNQLWLYDNATGLISLQAAPTLCLNGGTPSDRSCQVPPFNAMPYCNPALGAVERAQDLVSRLSLTEKSLLLQNNNPGISRLGVPPLQFNEALHGVVSGCGASTYWPEFDGNNTGCPTSFPHALLLGATFNRTLWSAVGEAISTEARGLHNQGIVGLFFWAPDINLFRDPRWGRGQEVPGEDPFLNGEYVMRWGRAMQNGEDARYFKVISTGKHYADYDLEGNGGTDRGSFNAIVTAQDQVEYYWPAWRAAIEGAELGSVMCSYNAVNGMPSCGNSLFINTVMRDEWNFDGFVVSDCGAISDGAFSAYIQKYYNGSSDYQVRQGIEGGCDLECGGFYAAHMAAAVTDGVLPQASVDQAAVRVLSHAVRLGMLDDPATQIYSTYGADRVDTPAHRQLALEAAQQGIVLLKNDGLLPLKAGVKVAAIGPHFNASADLISIYHGTVELVQAHTPLLALQRLQQQGRLSVVAAVPGCVGTDGDDPVGSTACLDTTGFADAAAAAKGADVAIVFVGLTPGQMNNDSSDAREDEGWDRHLTVLPGAQEQLIQTVFAANPNTVVVLIHGGSLSVEWTQANVPAILDAHYPGELGGDAIAGALVGDYSPSGRLTTTVYPSTFVATRPISDMGLRTVDGITYKYYTGQPLWTFGFGLSYTTFQFVIVDEQQPEAIVTKATTEAFAEHHRRYYASAGRETGPVGYFINVTNTGTVTSDVSVLGFVDASNVSRDAPPLHELFDFGRVSALAPGETVTVYLSVSGPVISIVDEEGVERILPGEYKIRIGVPGSAEQAVATATLVLAGEPQAVFSLPAIRERHAKLRPL